MLGEYMAAPVSVMNRRQIEDTGASTLAQLLGYNSATAFSTPEGSYASGAQFAEMRGLGPENTLILINGRRAYASASDISVNAFDLGSIPISAVERVELSYDATSVKHGTDAIGGVLNIVLKSCIDQPTAEVRFGTASGGGNLTTLSRCLRSCASLFAAHRCALRSLALAPRLPPASLSEVSSFAGPLWSRSVLRSRLGESTNCVSCALATFKYSLRATNTWTISISSI